MKRLLLPLSLIVLFVSSINAQKKSVLIAEISTLQSKLDSLKAEVATAHKKQKVAETESESYKSEVDELKDANATLLKNLTSFTEVSTKNSKNFNLALAQLSDKENQLKAIYDGIEANDSTVFVVLTNAKKTLGENAKIGVSNGAVTISSDLNTLFGNDTGSKITSKADTWVKKISEILIANPKTIVKIEGLSMTGNLKLPAQQAAAISEVLQSLSISPDRISTLGKDGNLKEGIVINIKPKYDDFYLMVKENMKNGQ